VASLLAVAGLCGCTALAKTPDPAFAWKGSTSLFASAPVPPAAFHFGEKLAAERAAKIAADEKAIAARAHARAMAAAAAALRARRSTTGSRSGSDTTHIILKPPPRPAPIVLLWP
jgi:hypothetical protein